jgi:hypothetical protein
MLAITVVFEEAYDEAKQKFVVTKGVDIELEHSLVSVSKWESRFEKPFLSNSDKTDEEMLFYIECMFQTEKFPGGVFSKFSQKNVDQINEYINAKMTATWFATSAAKPNREIITAELVYYWMIALNIPFECQHWHFNRLMTLIKVCNEKNAPPKKVSHREAMERQRELNAQRRAQMGSKG